MGPIGYPETSVTKYYFPLRNRPEELGSQGTALLKSACRCGTVQTRLVRFCSAAPYIRYLDTPGLEPLQ